jgi:hypothetical protein
MELDTFIDQWLHSWTGNMPDKLLCYYADDVFYIDPAQPTGLSGKEKLRQYFIKLLSKNPDWVWKAKEIIPTKEGCTLKWEAQIPVGTETIILSGLDIIEISEWKIIRNEVYFDRSAWIKAIQKQSFS